MTKIKIYKPNIKTGIHRHSGDSFRKMLDLWQEAGYIDIIETNNPYCWMNEIGDILLHDRDSLMWLNQYTPATYNFALFGNEVILNEKSFPWIYWVRHPERFINIKRKSYEKRIYKTVFISKIENEVQLHYRKKQDLSKYIDFFDMYIDSPDIPYRYTPEQYTKKISSALYGLCLRGYGPKCHREIELMAYGTVPLITPDVDLTYYNKLKENVHYFNIKTSEDIKKILDNTTKEKWEAMSKACIEWYEQNSSVKGSFDTTMKIINENYVNNKNRIESISTLANKKAKNDIELLLLSLELYNPHTPVYICCDNYIEKYIKNSNYNLKLYTINTLDKYGEINRQEMERKNMWLDFMLEKTASIKLALEHHNNTLFVDSDILFLNNINNLDFNKQIGLSPHFIKKQNEDLYGKYNGGFFYVNDKSFCDWFIDKSKTDSKYYEQYTLNFVNSKYNMFEFPIQFNFGWWRLLECNENEIESRMKKFTINNNEIQYNNKPLICVHTHFIENNETYVGKLTNTFNDFIINLLNKCDNNKYNKILSKIHEQKNNPLSLPFLNIIIQFYNEKNQDRKDELVIALTQNLNNPYVKSVINLLEKDNKHIPEEIAKHPKYCEYELSKWYTYKDVFDFCNKNLKNEYCCIINLDMMLDQTSKWSNMKSDLDNGYIYALSRHEFDYLNDKIELDPNFVRLFHSNTQDGWFFKTPVQINDCNFEIGLLGCDNAIADRINKSGYKILNKALEYKLLHIDLIKGKSSTNFLDFSKKEQGAKIQNKKPEEKGQYLLPIYELVQNVSLDNFARQFGITEEEKYKLICDIMSIKIKIRN